MPRGDPNLCLLNTPWPEERTKRLRRMFAAGQSDKEISLALGVSIRAVLGKRRRLGLLRMHKFTNDPLETALRRVQRERDKEGQS